MKTKYPIGIKNFRHPPDHITPKNQLFHEYGADPDNARFSSILNIGRGIEMISDGIKFFEVEVI